MTKIIVPDIPQAEFNYDENTPIIVFCHGIRSDASAMLKTAQFLSDRLKADAMTHNFAYPVSWKESIFINACAVADFLAKDHPKRPAVLVGHSMGGLVARVAN